LGHLDREEEVADDREEQAADDRIFRFSQAAYDAVTRDDYGEEAPGVYGEEAAENAVTRDDYGSGSQ
jgi:hypothetical protein